MPTNFHGFPSKPVIHHPDPEHPLLIGLTGKLGSGKSTVCQYIVDRYDGVRLAFADALKIEVYDVLASRQYPNDLAKMHQSDYLVLRAGLDQAPTPKIVLPEPYEKIAWINANKNSLRIVLQYWGSQFRRDVNSKTYWLDRIGAEVADLRGRESVIVIDDVRFHNEKQYLDTLGFSTIKLLVPNEIQEQRVVKRDGRFDQSSHNSETELDSMRVDYVLDNKGSLAELPALVDKVVKSILNK